MCLPVRFNVYGLSHKSEIAEWSTAKKFCSSVVTGDLIIWYSVIIDLLTIVHISHVHPCRFSADNFIVDASNKNRGLFQLSHSLCYIQFSNFFFHNIFWQQEKRQRKEPSNERIVSLWKFIGLFSWSFWGGGDFLFRCTFIQFILHFPHYYSSRWQLRPLQTTKAGKKNFRHKHMHTHTIYIRRTVVSIHYSFRIVILLGINNIAFSVWLSLISLSVTYFRLSDACLLADYFYFWNRDASDRERQGSDRVTAIRKTGRNVSNWTEMQSKRCREWLANTKNGYKNFKNQWLKLHQVQHHFESTRQIRQKHIIVSARRRRKKGTKLILMSI